MSVKQTARKHGRRYHWRYWFARGHVKLHRGKDFDVMPHSMAQMARQAAASKKHRVKLSISVEEDSITLTVAGNA